VADGLIHPKDVPAPPSRITIPPRPKAETMSDATWAAARAEYEAAIWALTPRVRGEVEAWYERDTAYGIDRRQGGRAPLGEVEAKGATESGEK
jgi:hypothetical protein